MLESILFESSLCYWKFYRNHREMLFCLKRERERERDIKVGAFENLKNIFNFFGPTVA